MSGDEENALWCEKFAENFISKEQEDVQQIAKCRERAAQAAEESAKWPEPSEQRGRYRRLAENWSKHVEWLIKDAEWNARTVAKLRQMADELRRRAHQQDQ